MKKADSGPAIHWLEALQVGIGIEFGSLSNRFHFTRVEVLKMGRLDKNTQVSRHTSKAFALRAIFREIEGKLAISAVTSEFGTLLDIIDLEPARPDVLRGISSASKIKFHQNLRLQKSLGLIRSTRCPSDLRSKLYYSTPKGLAFIIHHLENMMSKSAASSQPHENIAPFSSEFLILLEILKAGGITSKELQARFPKSDSHFFLAIAKLRDSDFLSFDRAPYDQRRKIYNLPTWLAAFLVERIELISQWKQRALAERPLELPANIRSVES